MSNERRPSGNQINRSGARPSGAHRQAADQRRMPPPNVDFPPNAAPRSASRPTNATQRSAPNTTQKKASPSFAARPQNTASRPPVNRTDAAKGDPRNAAQKKEVGNAPKKQPLHKKKAVEEQAPVRRRNDESYVFSRSLSETHERILEERRERLEDAKKFQKEDVNHKLRIGLISFVAAVLLVSGIVAAVISCSLGTDKIKKNKGEYIYNIGTKTSNVAYTDSVRGDMIYISMNSIAELCELTMTGSKTELKFTAKSGDWIAFSPDSSTARINGYGISMPAPAYIKDTSCSVPLEFLEYVLDGITVDLDLSKNTVTVRRVEYTDSTPLEPHYLDVSFQLKVDSMLTPLDENKYFAGQPIFSFKNDLTAYEQYLNPSDPTAFMVLLNKQNPIDDPSYEPETLILVENEIKNYWIDASVAKALEAMLMEIEAAGFGDIYITSGYRSYNYQSILYNNYINAEMAKDPSLTREEAEARASMYSAKPGTSEHHTGLCVDITTTAMGGLLEESFSELEIYDWLMANAWKFGFTLRYPADKVDITGYVFEPWHWRFVGRDAALEMLRTGECFEEYLERTQAPKE